MSSFFPAEDEESNPNIEVQSLGPAILIPQIIQRFVSKTNEALSDHRDWLANLPQRDGQEPLADPTSPPHSLITLPPSLNKRLASVETHELLPRQVLIECIPGISSASAEASSSALKIAAASVSAVNLAASSQLSSLNASLVAIKTNASIASVAAVTAQQAASSAVGALSTAQQLAFAASVSFGSAQATQAAALASASTALAVAVLSLSAASLAALAASSSATSAISSASSSASVSASSAILSTQSSASVAIMSAQSVASDARVTAINAITQAQASVDAIHSAASTSIVNAQIASMSALKFALVVTFSIIGSSLLSILAYFLIARYRKRRQQRREYYARTLNQENRSEESEGRPSLSDFPFPANRKTWASQHGGSERSGPRSTQFPIQGPTRKTWSGKGEDNATSREMDGDDDQPRPSLSRKNTLTYDPNRPEEPPRFRSWLEENFKNVITTESLGEKEEKKAEEKSKKMEKESNGKPVIGTAY